MPFKDLKTIAIVILLAGATFAGTPLVDAAEEQADSSDDNVGISPDILWYSNEHGVSIATAEEEMQLEVLAGRLDQALSKNAREVFGGLWVQHRPEFRIRVWTLPNEATVVEAYASELGISPWVDIEERAKTLQELVATQRSLHDLIDDSVDFASMVDVETGTVELEVASERDERIVASSDVPRSVVVTVVDELAETAQNLIGGKPLTTCTSGWSVKQTNGVNTGVSTAGHCTDSQSFQGDNLPFQDGQWSGDADSQWHKTPGYQNPARVYTGIDTRDVLNVYSRAETANNTSICMYGKATGYHCATMTNKNYDPSDSCIPNSTATWMYSYNGNDDLADHGDSGGPVFKNNGAYGTIACRREILGPGGAMIYMASNFMTRIGVEILEQ